MSRASSVEEIRERLEAVPSPPWDCRSTDSATAGRRVCRDEGDGYERLVAIAVGNVGYMDNFGPDDLNGGWSVPHDGHEEKERVAHFIAHAPTDPRYLLEVAKAAREVVKRAVPIPGENDIVTEYNIRRMDMKRLRDALEAEGESDANE